MMLDVLIDECDIMIVCFDSSRSFLTLGWENVIFGNTLMYFHHVHVSVNLAPECTYVRENRNNFENIYVGVLLVHLRQIYKTEYWGKFSVVIDIIIIFNSMYHYYQHYY